jgi:hypothetical protein
VRSHRLDPIRIGFLGSLDDVLQLVEEFERADKMDPALQTSDTEREDSDTRASDRKPEPAAKRTQG